MTNSPNAAITLPAASGPSWPWTSTTRVEATFKANRNIVANSKTDGKDEKSNGLRVPIAIITTTKLTMMLKVNKMSSNKGGSGTTNMAMINRTRTGKPKPARS